MTAATLRVVAGAFILVAACTAKETPAINETATTPATGGATAGFGPGPLAPAAGGRVIEIEATTGADGLNHFNPSEITAHTGDVVRVKLGVGVHNIHFLPDSNPGAKGLPTDASELLQLPGQTWDIAVTFPAGVYYFQCDPHALLGMKGHLTVQ
jgi:plastocyanin